LQVHLLELVFLSLGFARRRVAAHANSFYVAQNGYGDNTVKKLFLRH